MSQAQRDISEYLQCDLYHSIGAYRVAARSLHELAGRLGDPASSQTREDGEERGLRRLARMSAHFNDQLDERLHAIRPVKRYALERHERSSGEAGEWPVRTPMPAFLPLSRVERFAVDSTDAAVESNRKQPWASDSRWNVVPRFYAVVVAALEGDERHDNELRSFAASVLAPRDGATRTDEDDRDGERVDGLLRQRREGRLKRYCSRKDAAIAALGPEKAEPAAMYTADQEILELVVRGHLGQSDRRVTTQQGSLAMYVIAAAAEAHLSMHAVEAWKSMCLGERAKLVDGPKRDWLKRELDRSIALSTFSHCASRTAPWIFAASDEERKAVLADAQSAWENLRPMLCMWVAAQVDMLALHRRGYAHYLNEEPEQAYNDFHKLQRVIRDASRRVLAAPLHVDGAAEFLAALDAQAHHHIGELYRAEHAHRPALKHFEAASDRVKRLEKEDKLEEVLANSRWHVQLQVSRGKAAYEMGRHKDALFWHLHAWKRFLTLLAGDRGTETDTKEIDEAIGWLERVRYEPELRKSEVSGYVGPVIDQLDRTTVASHLGALAAEVLLRLGHLLFVLNVGRARRGDAEAASDDRRPETTKASARAQIGRTLAFDCLRKAAECDPHSTLAGADLLKARYRFNYRYNGPLPKAHNAILQLPRIDDLGRHWPHGGNEYERLARVAEYVILKARERRFAGRPPGVDDGACTDGFLARDLLYDFFMSTDSINVRKSQTQRILMKQRTPAELPRRSGAAIELICMRRYSSAFPMLPRPSAFRALGGGYLLRLRTTEEMTDETADETADETTAYGIVVDPGYDFVENLYRAGYGISDIDMIIVTHDHVDHVGALDPLLALLHLRATQKAKRTVSATSTPKPDGMRVPLIVSRSVYLRYDSAPKIKDSGNLYFACFEDGEPLPGQPNEAFAEHLPEPFEIVTMSSAAGDSAESGSGPGHRDLSDMASHGICVRVKGGGPSIAISSDTPAPPMQSSGAEYRRWRKAWLPALEADAVVTHLCSVPLTELRRMDPIRGTPAIREDEKTLREVADSLEGADEALGGQVAYAQWLRSRADERKNEAKIVGPVPKGWLPPRDHLYLEGLLRWARAYRDARRKMRRSEQGGIFVIGELSEELGTMRSKVAARLNDLVFGVSERSDTLRRLDPDVEKERAPHGPGALTADIGMHICAYEAEGEDDTPGRKCVQVRCTACNLDTDRVADERYHEPVYIREVCVKGENEGIFYNCREHNPAGQGDPMFLEQLERFDVYGR